MAEDFFFELRLRDDVNSSLDERPSAFERSEWKKYVSLLLFTVLSVPKCAARPAEPTARRKGSFAVVATSTTGGGGTERSINCEFDEEVDCDDDGEMVLTLFEAIVRVCLLAALVLNGALMKTSLDIVDEALAVLVLMPGGYDSE